MAGLFSAPSMPKIEVKEAPKVIDESSSRAKTLEMLRKKKGRAANMLAGDYYAQAQSQSNAISGQPNASKTLLGQ
jgi:hypothetical protein